MRGCKLDVNQHMCKIDAAGCHVCEYKPEHTLLLVVHFEILVARHVEQPAGASLRVRAAAGFGSGRGKCLLPLAKTNRLRTVCEEQVVVQYIMVTRLTEDSP
jgi:hypothetical protein